MLFTHKNHTCNERHFSNNTDQTLWDCLMMSMLSCSRNSSSTRRATTHLFASFLRSSRAGTATATDFQHCHGRIIAGPSPPTAGRRAVIGHVYNSTMAPIHTRRSLDDDDDENYDASHSAFRFNDNGRCFQGCSTVNHTTSSPAQHRSGHSVLSMSLRHHLQQHTCQLQHQQQHQHQRARCFSSQVFVSRHNQSMQRTPEEILDFLQRQGVSTSGHRSTATHIILKECPFCEKPTDNKADNFHKCYIQKCSGAFFCHRCGTGGSWFDLKKTLGNFELSHQSQNSSSPPTTAPTSMTSHTSANYRKGAAAAQSSSQYGSAGGGTYARTQQQPQQMMKTRGGNAGAVAPSLPMPSQRLQALYSSQLLDGQHSSSSSLDTPTDATASSAARAASQDALRYLTETRGLSVATLRKYGVGLGLYSFYDDSNTWMNAACVTFPWLLSVADVQEQERLRGGCFEWEPPAAVATVATATTPDGNDVAPEETKVNKTKKPKGKKTTTTKTTEKASTKKESSSSTEMLKKSNFLTRRIKARAIHNKKHQRLDPPGGGWGLFGFHTVPNNNDDEQPAELVLTEGEYDAMAVYQATGRPAVSLPNGCRSLPVEVLPLLERFDKVYLWMDNDGPGQEGAEIFAKKIGMERCFIVRPTANNVRVVNSKNNHNVNGGDGGGGGSSSSSSSSFDDDDCDDDDDASLAMPKDANEALLMGLDLEAIIRDARLIPHERIATFASMRSEVMHEIRFPEKYVGTPMSSLPALTNIIKGFRRGEMTVLTGPTGSGKTTFLSQQSIDLAEQGINVLWGSFEIKNSRLIKKLLQQFAREPLVIEENDQKLDAIADRFEQLPLHFMKFHGGTDVDDVLDAMDYAVYVNDVQHIILDNMQFMISRTNRRGNDSGSTFDKFDVQDMAVEKFRKFATDRNVHITLVVHPRKQQESAKLSMDSIYGSAKATQEADTVMILQVEPGGKKYVEIKKNRFNGDLGHVNLHFDRHSGRYNDKPIIIPAGSAAGSRPATSSINARPAPAALNGGGKPAASGGNVWDEMFGSN